ncbi:DUF3263 domain-containing protein [Microbacterium betulae]|uniref:DUF3263 domain-containing protein n=1 Tax=Microbacterium betulae TaxID=2981139 RepID=A0AA97FIE8_9MICO|nr:DUF3263 domain-containing protein [Microbacterium sp. AB]WOF23813.1 DUF3263 domain-containing protein [Microbacterium sp. AB]
MTPTDTYTETPLLTPNRARTGVRSPRPTPGQLLDFEREHREQSGWKDEAIRAELGIAPAWYHALLGRAWRSPEGQAHDPILCRLLADQYDRFVAARRGAAHLTQGPHV